MLILKQLNLVDKDKQVFPFTLEVFRDLSEMKFESNVTFLVGENGSGKSTLLEGVAAACDLPTVGTKSVARDDSMLEARSFSDHIKLVWSIKSHKGFFLRAEDFFGFVKYLKDQKKKLKKDMDLFNRKFTGYGRDLAVGSARGQLMGFQNRYGDLDSVSHGEGFLRLFQERIVPNGLYLLDEPEAALSPSRQLTLITLIKRMVSENCQFIIATHSPILMAFPKATIYLFSDGKIKKVKFDDVDHVSLTRSFLNNPEAYLSKL